MTAVAQTVKVAVALHDMKTKEGKEWLRKPEEEEAKRKSFHSKKRYTKGFRDEKRRRKVLVQR